MAKVNKRFTTTQLQLKIKQPSEDGCCPFNKAQVIFMEKPGYTKITVGVHEFSVDMYTSFFFDEDTRYEEKDILIWFFRN